MAATTAEWTVLEKLLLAQAVYKFGEDNWFQIARNLKQHSLLDRQPEFFNQKNCSLQYYLLIESLETEKRQTKSSAQDMPPVVKLAKQLYIQRIDELKRAIKQDDEKFLKLIGEIEEIRNGKWDSKLTEKVESDPTIKETTTTATTPMSTATSTPAEQPSPSQQESSANENQPAELPLSNETPTSTITPPTTTTPTTTTAPIPVENNDTHKITTDENTPVDSSTTTSITETPETSKGTDIPIITTTEATSPSEQPSNSEEEKEFTPKEPLDQSQKSSTTEPMELDTTQDSNTVTVPSPTEEARTPTPVLEEQQQQQPQITSQPAVLDQKMSFTPTLSGSPQSDASYQSAMETSNIVPGGHQLSTTPELSIEQQQQQQPQFSSTQEPLNDLRVSESEKRKYEEEDQGFKRQRLEEPTQEIKKEDQDELSSHEQRQQHIITEEERTQVERSSEPKSPEAINLKSPEAPLSMMASHSSSSTTGAGSSSGGGGTIGADGEGTESVTGSESNAPTPTSTSDKRKSKDEQRQQKSWQKNINLLWREIANHKNGAMFMNPIKEATAPLYYDVVKHPVDLKTIKNRIRDGVIKTTVEFERDIVLMLTNSLMYNKEGTEIYQMALEMLEDVNEQLKLFKAADSNSSTTATHTRKASTVAKDRRKSVAE